MINPPPPPRPPTPHKAELAAIFITDNPAFEAEGEWDPWIGQGWDDDPVFLLLTKKIAALFFFIFITN
jgi:hypothetical protein